MFIRTFFKLPQPTAPATSQFFSQQPEKRQKLVDSMITLHLNNTQRHFCTRLRRSHPRGLTTGPQQLQQQPFHTTTNLPPSLTTYKATSNNNRSFDQFHTRSNDGVPSLHHITQRSFTTKMTKPLTQQPSISSSATTSTTTKPTTITHPTSQLSHTTHRKISFKPGNSFQSKEQQQAEEDLRRFAFKKPTQYNLSQNPNVKNPSNMPNTTLTGTRLPNPGSQTTTMSQTIKQHFFEDPTIPRWRKDLVRIQDFLVDSSRPLTLESDQTITRFGKKMIRIGFAPWRRLYKFGRWITMKLLGANRFVLGGLLFSIASFIGFLTWSFKLLDRVNMSLSRELFVRSTVIDLAARLDSYGLLGYEQTNPVLTTFKIYVDAADDDGNTWYNYTNQKSAEDQGFNGYKPTNTNALAFASAPKNYKGQEMMKAFLMQAISLPMETSRILQALYDPKSRIDEVSEGIHLVFLEKLADTDPTQANEKCPAHIKAIAGRVVEEWFKRTRFQMIEEKQKKLEKELKVEKIDDLTPEGRRQMKEKLEEFNSGITFDLSKREKRKLFWKGILTGIMLETGLVGLENETTFLRLARDYAIKGCLLRKIPEKVKVADTELERSSLSGSTLTTDQALIAANPAGEFSFNSADDLIKIRDQLTQQPYSPDHGQIDQRFLNFLFGREFCQEYGLTPDSSPYVHQIAPLALLDLATWTHPSTLFDLTHTHQPIKLQGSKYTLPPAEYEKVEMYNFMLDEMTKKDRAYAYLDKQYRQTSISKDELIVLPLTQPQDSLRNPGKYGLDLIETQLSLLGGRIPQCYQDTYGAYAHSIFLFDMVILRNLLEIFRLKRSLGELGTTRIRDMSIPSSSNYYGNYDRLLQGDLLDVIKQEQNLTESYRLRGVDFKKEYDARVQSDSAQYNVRDPLGINKGTTKDKDGKVIYKSQDEILMDEIDHDFQTKRSQNQLRLSSKADPSSVTVDAELLKGLSIKENTLSDLTPDGIMRIKEDQDRQRRAKKWVDNGSV